MILPQSLHFFRFYHNSGINARLFSAKRAIPYQRIAVLIIIVLAPEISGCQIKELRFLFSKLNIILRQIHLQICSVVDIDFSVAVCVGGKQSVA